MPLTCIGCGKAALRPMRPGRRRVLGGQGGLTCRRCRERLALTGVVSAGAYGSPLFKRGVQWLKFRGVRPVAPVLAALIAERLPVIAPLPILRGQAVLLPIPLYPRRQRERGFNQSADIVEALGEATGIPAADMLIRQRSTLTQTKLPLKMRRENLTRAFALASRLPDTKYFLVVDDVATTGSTLSAAAEVLREAGAAQVWGVTAARG